MNIADIYFLKIFYFFHQLVFIYFILFYFLPFFLIYKFILINLEKKKNDSIGMTGVYLISATFCFLFFSLAFEQKLRVLENFCTEKYILFKLLKSNIYLYDKTLIYALIF